MAHRFRINLLLGTLCLLFVGLLNSSGIMAGNLAAIRQPPPIYGYEVGDHYKFSDHLIETLDGPEESLLWETRHEINVRVLEIVENAGDFTIRITAQVTNLSNGFTNYSSEQYFEGYTPIVAGPRNYFTHNYWEMHLIDWNMDVEAWQTLTGYLGYREQDLDTRYFHWNFTQWVNRSLSIIDIDNDGATDGYQSYNCYTAQFDSTGIATLRRYYTAFNFENGIRYSRLRQVEQLFTTDVTDTPINIQPYFTILISGIIVMCVLLATIVIIPRQRHI